MSRVETAFIGRTVGWHKVILSSLKDHVYSLLIDLQGTYYKILSNLSSDDLFDFT